MSCPRCGNRRVVPIVYGEIAPTLEELERQEWIAGGCVIFEDAPDRICLECGYRWLGRLDGEATPVVPQPHEPRPPGVLGLAALVDAMIDRARFEGSHDDLASYHSLRFELLCRELRLPVDPLEPGAHVVLGPQLERSEAEQLLALLGVAVAQAGRSVSPFDGFLEAGVQVAAIYGQHHQAMQGLRADNLALNRSVAFQCLAALEPDLVERTTTEARLRQLGLPDRPDEHDYL